LRARILLGVTPYSSRTARASVSEEPNPVATAISNGLRDARVKEPGIVGNILGLLRIALADRVQQQLIAQLGHLRGLHPWRDQPDHQLSRGPGTCCRHDAVGTLRKARGQVGEIPGFLQREHIAPMGRHLARRRLGRANISCGRVGQQHHGQVTPLHGAHACKPRISPRLVAAHHDHCIAEPVIGNGRFRPDQHAVLAADQPRLV